MSRFVGVAPVILTQNGIRLSRPLTFYSYFVVTAISGVILSGFALDLLTEPKRSLRVRTPTSRMIWVANLSIVILITSVAAYRAPARFLCIINCLKQIQKIKIFINGENNRDLFEKLKTVMVISTLVGLGFLVFFDIYGYVTEALTHGREVRTLFLYSFLYYEYFIVLLVELQFILIAQKLLSALRLVNDALQQLMVSFKTQRNNNYNRFRNEFTSYDNYGLKESSTVPNKVINYVVDSLTVKEKIDDKKYFRSDNRTVRDLSNAYTGICDILRRIDDSHGFLLLLILISFFMQLIITPYYLITTLYTSMNQINYILLQISWCMYHIISMLMVVEPCYQTQKEMDRTQMLVLYLLRYISSTDPMFVDVDIFCKQLYLDRPSYTPLGMCTISRPLTVTIIGAVMTYLVIIFQLRSYESNSKDQL
nr:gustatory receptor for sugar taste 43a-like [Vanessa tameamea]